MKKTVTMVAAILALVSLIAGLIVLLPSQPGQAKLSEDFIRAIDKSSVADLTKMFIPDTADYMLPEKENGEKLTKEDIISSLGLNAWYTLSADPEFKEIKDIYLLSYDVVDQPASMFEDSIVQTDLVVGIDYLTTDDQAKSVYANETLSIIDYKNSLKIAFVGDNIW